MCRSPLAYGHATATRIFLGDVAVGTGANDRESPAYDFPGAKAACACPQCDDQHGEELPRQP